MTGAGRQGGERVPLRRHTLWRARFRPVALPMLLFFGLFVAIFIRGSAWENDQQMLEFRLLSQQVVDKIRTGLEEQEVFLEQLERSLVVQALERSGWNQTKAAGMLGLNRDQIRYRVEKFKLEKSS